MANRKDDLESGATDEWGREEVDLEQNASSLLLMIQENERQFMQLGTLAPVGVKIGEGVVSIVCIVLLILIQSFACCFLDTKAIDLDADLVPRHWDWFNKVGTAYSWRFIQHANSIVWQEDGQTKQHVSVAAMKIIGLIIVLGSLLSCVVKRGGALKSWFILYEKEKQAEGGMTATRRAHLFLLFFFHLIMSFVQPPLFLIAGIYLVCRGDDVKDILLDGVGTIFLFEIESIWIPFFFLLIGCVIPDESWKIRMPGGRAALSPSRGLVAAMFFPQHGLAVCVLLFGLIGIYNPEAFSYDLQQVNAVARYTDGDPKDISQLAWTRPHQVMLWLSALGGFFVGCLGASIQKMAMWKRFNGPVSLGSSMLVNKVLKKGREKRQGGLAGGGRDVEEEGEEESMAESARLLDADGDEVDEDEEEEGGHEVLKREGGQDVGGQVKMTKAVGLLLGQGRGRNAGDDAKASENYAENGVNEHGSGEEGGGVVESGAAAQTRLEAGEAGGGATGCNETRKEGGGLRVLSPPETASVSLGLTLLGVVIAWEGVFGVMFQGLMRPPFGYLYWLLQLMTVLPCGILLPPLLSLALHPHFPQTFPALFPSLQKTAEGEPRTSWVLVTLLTILLAVAPAAVFRHSQLLSWPEEDLRSFFHTQSQVLVIKGPKEGFGPMMQRTFKTLAWRWPEIYGWGLLWSLAVGIFLFFQWWASPAVG
uniref:Uncharacterized protein n=1 Tax=Chromera velia CCMP2878 TaxID=1169474 RepID=A0A0G4HM49_9ALVE|eukprot:Cvel_7443.t1-p1 / transcript=Cvel_7443.t1 / gene=Cvel_7443 / organism=Chromera_velia_CCMP2878 / gene_product=hypothetical protein / transcript_product=hypothetical protein / location=Cvel_scaffold389:22356-24923(+) / protein_length=704 / sequence_SO=supercontig / SO=protein_coding / is_pseudo=false